MRAVARDSRGAAKRPCHLNGGRAKGAPATRVAWRCGLSVPHPSPLGGSPAMSRRSLCRVRGGPPIPKCRGTSPTPPLLSCSYGATDTRPRQLRGNPHQRDGGAELQRKRCPDQGGRGRHRSFVYHPWGSGVDQSASCTSANRRRFGRSASNSDSLAALPIDGADEVRSAGWQGGAIRTRRR
jgi:hypothetical protein